MKYLFLLVLVSCASWSDGDRRTARTVLDVAQMSCVIANIVMDEAALKEACHITDELAPEFRKLLNASKTVAAQRATGTAACK